MAGIQAGDREPGKHREEDGFRLPHARETLDESFLAIPLFFQTEIRKIKLRRGKPQERLFDPKTPSDIQLKLLRICKELEIQPRSPHKIRKTYISTLLNQGFDLDFVREQVGHQNLQTTLNCYTFSTTRKEENREKLNKIRLSS